MQTTRTIAPVVEKLSTQPRLLSLGSYVSTTAVTALSIVASLGTSALLARTWPMADFMLFTTLNRYLSLIYCITCLSLGFGVVQCYVSGTNRVKEQVLPNALLISLLLCLFAGILGQLWADPISRFFETPTFVGRWAITGCWLWVTAQSLYHVVLSYARGIGLTREANWLMFLVKTGLVIAVSLAAFLSGLISVPRYYGVLGGVILAVTAFFVYEFRSYCTLSLDFKLWRELITYSSSRCVDALLKHALIPLLVTMLYFLGRQDVAGGTVVLAMLLRGVESLFQPLVLMVLADALNNQASTSSARLRVQASWDCVLLFSLPTSLLLTLFAESILALWLGESYRSLGDSFRYFALALPAILGTVLLRGNLDAHYRFSPLAVTGFVSNALIFVGTAILHSQHMLSVNTTATMLAAVYWIQFVVLFVLLRQQFGTRLFSLTLWRLCSRSFRRGGPQG